MKKIGKYEILEMLGQGGMGVVYKAFDPFLQREVAIKVISEKAFDNLDIKERFFREARAAAKLLHENITVVHDLGEHDGKPYIVMEYLTGVDLRAILNAIKANEREPLLLPQKLDYARQICKGFDFLHAKDIIHRDLKPENIRIVDNGKAKIMDFGIAKSLVQATTMTQAGMVLGTPGYMSPEQIRGQKVDKRSDIFSFGILFYELLTNKIPFKGENVTSVCYNIVHEPPDHFDDLEIENVAPVREIILKALKKDPRERYQSFSELLTDLETAIRLKEAEFKRMAEEKRKKVEKLLADSDNFLKKKNFAKALEKAEEAGKFATDSQNIRELIVLIKEDEEKENRRRLVDEKVRTAQKLIKEKQYQQALGFLSEALQIWPEQIEALKLMQDAEDGIRREEQKSIDDQLVAGQDLLKRNDFGQAQKIVEEILRARPEDAEAVKLAEAIDRKKAEEEKKRQVVAEKLDLARKFTEEERYHKAIGVLKEILKLAPGHAEAKSLLQRLIEETNQQIASAVEETKAISIEVAETELVKPKLAAKKPPRPLAKAPFKFKRVHVIAAAAALLLGMVLIYRLFIYMPPSPSGYVALNILPWAEVAKIETSDGRDVTATYAAAGKIVTPCRLVLPEGSFRISLTNSVLKESLTLSVAVKPGEFQEVKRKMPGFNYNNLLPRF